jgi:GntR family transcriptional regulator
MIQFRLSTHSGVPPYLQIVQQVKQALSMGILQEGDRLPTVKEVVGMVAINPNTVFKAYRELESEGIVQGRTGIGTFVLKRPDGPPPDITTGLAKELDSWIDKATAAGLRSEHIEALIRTQLQERGGHETGRHH